MTAAPPESPARREPPPAVMNLMNRIPKTLLRTPLHGLMSKNVMLMTFAGRKTGKGYTIPLSFVQAGDTLYLSTERPWYKNLAAEDGVLVKLVLRGEERSGVARATTDTGAVEDGLRIILSRYPGYGRFIGVPVGEEGSPDEAALGRAARGGRALITVRLNGETRRTG